MKATQRNLAVFGFLATMVIIAPARAGGLMFLSESAAARMTDDDYVAMNKATLEALEDTTVPSTKVWTNPKTGSGGTVKTLQAFAAKNGAPCKLVQHNTQARKLTHEAKSTLCLIEGHWKLVSEDYATVPSGKK